MPTAALLRVELMSMDSVYSAGGFMSAFVVYGAAVPPVFMSTFCSPVYTALRPRVTYLGHLFFKQARLLIFA